MKQAREKLQVACDWFSDPLRIHREAEGLRWLMKLAPEGVITELFFEDREHHLIGMAPVPWPHENWKSLLLHGRIGEPRRLRGSRDDAPYAGQREHDHCGNEHASHIYGGHIAPPICQVPC